MIQRFKNWYSSISNKKTHVEFFTAVLTVPVLITVILVNLNNLTPRKSTDTTPTPSPKVSLYPSEKITVVMPTNTQVSPQPTQIAECTKKVGPVTLNYPQEAQVVNQDPVCLEIDYQQQNYCSVAWAYRINGGNWSNYTDKSICLYGLSPGNKKLELKVRSITSTDQVLLQRNFVVPGSLPTSTPVPPTSTPVPSPTIAETPTP